MDMSVQFVKQRGFIKWINKQYCENKQKAFIVEQHVSLIKEYRTVEF